MANPNKGEAVAILPGGHELTLCYDFDALAAAEDVADRGIAEMLADLSKGSGRLGTLRALIYGGLRRYHREISAADVGAMLLENSAGNGKAFSEAMQKALASAFPQAAEASEGGEEADPPKDQAGTGTHS